MLAPRILDSRACGFDVGPTLPRVQDLVATPAAAVDGTELEATDTHDQGPCGHEYETAGGLIQYEESHPYGTTAYRAGDSGIDVSPRRYRYTGMEQDEETGLGYHTARYYAGWLGRWTASDPIGLGGGVNRFGYCGGDPVGKSDTSGLAPPTLNDQIRDQWAMPEEDPTDPWITTETYTGARSGATSPEGPQQDVQATRTRRKGKQSSNPGRDAELAEVAALEPAKVVTDIVDGTQVSEAERLVADADSTRGSDFVPVYGAVRGGQRQLLAAEASFSEGDYESAAVHVGLAWVNAASGTADVVGVGGAFVRSPKVFSPEWRGARSASASPPIALGAAC